MCVVDKQFNAITNWNEAIIQELELTSQVSKWQRQVTHIFDDGNANQIFILCHRYSSGRQLPDQVAI